MYPSQPVRQLSRAAKDHGPVLVPQAGHPAHLVDNLPPLGEGAGADADLADGPVAAEHDAGAAEGGEDDAEPGERGLEDVRRRRDLEGGGHLGEGARELHVRAGALAKGVDGRAPGVEAGV